MILRIIMWMFICAIVVGSINRTLEYLDHSLQKCIENCGDMDINTQKMLDKFEKVKENVFIIQRSDI